MKYFYFFIFLFILLSLISCSKQRHTTIKEPQEELSVNIELLKEYFVKEYVSIGCDPPKHIKNKRFDVQISLKNNSDTTIAFVIMSCSWQENFIINTSYLEFIGQDCNKNFPRETFVKAHDMFTLNASLEKSKYYITACDTCKYYSKPAMTKLGLIYIPFSQDIFSSYDSIYDSIMEDKSRWHIIWSNPLLLN